MRLVVHMFDKDPLWVFLTNSEVEDGDLPMTLHAEHLLQADETLAEVADMPQGTFALREGLAHPWHRQTFRRNKDFDRLLEHGVL